MVIAGLLLGAFPALLPAQARISESTAFRKDPGGTVLGTINPGTVVTPGTAQGDWTAATLEGWIFTASTSATARDGFDVVVTAANGENLRSGPNGRIVARLETGALLDRLAAKGGWTQVRRSGWVSGKALASGAPAGQGRAAGTAAPAPAEQATAAPATTGADRIESLRATPLVLAPEGPELATLHAGTSGQVIGRSGEWVQVQVEGWVREADLSEPASAALPGVTVAQVRADPKRYVGQLLEWKVQYISIQTADELRPEIPVGARYLLTRGPLPEPGFVYVIVTADQLPTFQAAAPLQEFTIRGRLRATQTRYLPTPVLELVQVMEPKGGTP